jgi:hypothetical protein
MRAKLIRGFELHRVAWIDPSVQSSEQVTSNMGFYSPRCRS